ncbi:MAG: LysR family transcriptional regulator [Rhodospirillaceae bacterium]|nr:LysR family transcriptional regulator [Rhodospirillaceae bacterium]MBT4588648.1 LysR family transcriptional regulator [Rhodospirillaceae bacterium]MBT5939905.1 LysR family transcriptional regulator [Rhodospirillaceae bacterium]
MDRRNLPLTGLRAFEAAARHLSFAEAAKELAVTATAVSHQIRNLEQLLNLKLFERQHRAVQLTQAGKALLPGTELGLNQLSETIERVSTEWRTGAVNLRATPLFVARWLAPRVALLPNENPDLEFRISPSFETANFVSDGIDLAIQFGTKPIEGVHCELLFKEEMLPVCSPDLLDANGGKIDLASLKNHQLIHGNIPGRETSQEWRTWLAAAGNTDIEPTSGLHFDNAAPAIASAIEGLGITLVLKTLVEPDLRDGRLVVAFQQEQPEDYAWYLVTRNKNLERPLVKQAWNWLLEKTG